MPELYRDLANVLRQHGCKPYMNRRQQMVVARECPAWPTSGFSFWVTAPVGVWYVGTWGGWVYRVPENTSMPALCLALLGDDEQPLTPDLPPDVRDAYGLVLLNEQEDDALFQQMRAAAEAEPPETSKEQFLEQMAARGLRILPQRAGAFIVERTESDSEERRLWFCLYCNHWYVRTQSGRLYGLDDTEVAGLCFFALRDDVPVIDAFSENMIQGYAMFEVSAELRRQIEQHVGEG